MAKRERTFSDLKDAWIGDAVLTLHARRRILAETGRIDAESSARMTSNRFLSAFGEPTAVEAIIGRIYFEKGLDAAFAWINEHLVPLFARQQENRLRRAGKKPGTPL